MKVMVIVKATKSSEAATPPSTELMAAMGAYNEQLVNAGIMVDGAGLKPSSAGARVQFSGANRLVIDGPFTETKELIAGYWVWQVSSLQEAIDWVKKCPNPMPEDSEIEIRPYIELEDLGEGFTPELREQESSLVAKLIGLTPPRYEAKPSMTIAGLGESYDHESRVKIPQHWERFIGRLNELPQATGILYGVAYDAQSDGRFQYLTGAEVADDAPLPEGFTSVKLEPRRYAVFPHLGHVSALPKAIDLIWSRWVPEATLTVAKAPCVERYTEEYDPQTGMGGMEIWIPLD